MLDAREIFAANLKSLMASNSKFSTPKKLAAHCYWLRSKKEGEKVSPRQILYALDTRDDVDPPLPSPTVDFVDAVAATFGLEAWLLLVPSLNPLSPPDLLTRGARPRGNGERPADHALTLKANPQKRQKDRKRSA